MGSSVRLRAPPGSRAPCAGTGNRVRCRSLSGGGRGPEEQGAEEDAAAGSSFKQRASNFADTLGTNLRKSVDYEIYKSVDQLDQMVDTSRMNVKPKNVKSLDELENANLNAWTSAVPLAGGGLVVLLLFILVTAPAQS